MDQQERIFIRVVEAGSLKAAAEQLDTDPSAVSRKVAALEQRLNVKLLHRSTKRSQPTEAGAMYYEGLRKLEAEFEALEAKVQGAVAEPQGLLRVASPVDFGARFVAPVLRNMQQAHPKLDVELVLGSQFEDLRAQDIDVAVRIGRLSDSSLISRKLGEVPRVIAAAKSYLDIKGRPKIPADLADLDFVFYSKRQSQIPLELQGPEGHVAVEVSGRFIVNSVSAIKAFVDEGEGLHHGPAWLFRDDILRGALERVLPEYDTGSYPLHAVYKATSYVPAKIRTFIDLMAECDLGL